MPAMTSVGTLNIKIAVTGVKEVEKNLSSINNFDLGGILSGFNKMRWALMSVQMAAGIVTGTLGLFGTVAMTSLKGIAGIIDFAIIKPMGLVIDIAKNAAIAFGAFSVAAIAGLTKLGVESVTAFGDVQEELKNTMSLIENPPVGAEKTLMDTANKLAVQWGIANNEIMAGFYGAAAAGLAFNDMIKVVSASTQFAIAADTDLNTSVMFAVGSLSQFNQVNADGSLKLEELGTMFKVFTKGANDSIQTLPEFMDALKNVGSIAEVLGSNYKDVTAALMVLSNASIRGAEGGTVLKTMMGRLASNTGSTKNALQDLGITQEDVNLNTHTLGEVLTTIVGKLDGVTDSAKRNEYMFELLGLRGVKAGKLLSGVGVNELNVFRTSLDDTGDVLTRVTDIKMAGFNKQMERLSAAFINLKTTIGGNLVAGLQQGLDKFFTRFNELTVVFDQLSAPWAAWIGGELPKLIDWLVDEFIDIKPRLMTIFEGVRDVISDVGKGIAKVWGDVSTWITNNWDRIKTGAKIAWDGIKTIITTVWNIISDTLFGKGFTGHGLFGDILYWWNENGPELIAQINGIFIKIGQIIEPIIGGWSKWFVGFSETSGGALQKINDVLGSFISWLNEVGVSGQTGLQTLSDLFKSIGQTLGTAFSKGMEILTALFDTGNKADPLTTALTSVANMFKKLSNFIEKIDVNTVLTAFTGLTNAATAIAASSLPDFFNKLLNVLSEPGFKDTMMGLYEILKFVSSILFIIIESVANFGALGSFLMSAFVTLPFLFFGVLKNIGGIIAGTTTWASVLGPIGQLFGVVGFLISGILGLIQTISGLVKGDLGNAFFGILKIVLSIAGILAIIAGGWIPALIIGITLFVVNLLDSFDTLKLKITEVAKWFFDKMLGVSEKIAGLLNKIFGPILDEGAEIKVQPEVKDFSDKMGVSIEEQKKTIESNKDIKAQAEADKAAKEAQDKNTEAVSLSTQALVGAKQEQVTPSSGLGNPWWTQPELKPTITTKEGKPFEPAQRGMDEKIYIELVDFADAACSLLVGHDDKLVIISDDIKFIMGDVATMLDNVINFVGKPIWSTGTEYNAGGNPALEAFGLIDTGGANEFRNNASDDVFTAGTVVPGAMGTETGVVDTSDLWKLSPPFDFNTTPLKLAPEDVLANQEITAINARGIESLAVEKDMDVQLVTANTHLSTMADKIESLDQPTITDSYNTYNITNNYNGGDDKSNGGA